MKQFTTTVTATTVGLMNIGSCFLRAFMTRIGLLFMKYIVS
ncbi:unnamed protein product [Schistosoma curassoni]|uniref:Uncharacterized protein n=1 Tax=Schistosoma curassoni TaxID=6186 RepID=A0A183JTW1_9TREM|nr:unnamed protein product [Schistosoma curassoni]